MVKASSHDIVAILRMYELADDTTVPRHIENLRYHHPNTHNTVASFRFRKHDWFVVFDDTAEDDEAYILSELKSLNPALEGALVLNPRDTLATFAVPFKGKEVYLFEVHTSKIRLDAELARRYPDVSRSTWQKYIKEGYVRVNLVPQTSPRYEITTQDELAIELPEPLDHSKESLPILYIDDQVIVINKPIGVLTHAKGALNDEFTVAEFFRRYTTYQLDTNRPGIVHRLDRDTSGVMIGARTPEAAHVLQKQFADRLAKKTYVAILSGSPKLAEAHIDLPLERNPSKPSTFRVDPKGKPAHTTYRVLAQRDNLTLVELKPTTGRTHQLRVHMAYLHAPILGDRLYGTKKADRLYLHAMDLEITIPQGDRRIFHAPPVDFIGLFPECADVS